MSPPFDKPVSAATGAVKRYLPWVVATALFMEQLDSTIVNTAVPAMAAKLACGRRGGHGLRFVNPAVL